MKNVTCLTNEGQGNVGVHHNLNEVFLEELADIFDAEHQLMSAYPSMARSAHALPLREAIESHRSGARHHTDRVEAIAAALGRRLKARKCKSMKSLLQEVEEILSRHQQDPALDALLIAAAQKIGHHKIATYGTLCEWARRLNHDAALRILETNLQEERVADQQLTGIAQNIANVAADTQDG